MNIESNLLNGVISAFNKRSKTLKHCGCKLTCTNEYDQGYERLNIDCEYLNTPPIQIRLSILSDGAMYFRTCQSQKIGWKHCIEFHGDISGIPPEKIEKLFEQALHLKDEKQLLKLWEKVAH